MALSGNEADGQDDDKDEDHEKEDGENKIVRGMSVGEWLHRVLRNEARPTFLLPSTSAGPDVMFVLCRKQKTLIQRVIYAVQVGGKLSLPVFEANTCVHRSREWP